MIGRVFILVILVIFKPISQNNNNIVLQTEMLMYLNQAR